MRERLIRRFIDLAVWCALLLTGFLVGHWWSEHGHDLVVKVAAWSTPAPGPGPPVTKAPLGPVKKAFFDRLERSRQQAVGGSQQGKTHGD